MADPPRPFERPWARRLPGEAGADAPTPAADRPTGPAGFVGGSTPAATPKPEASPEAATPEPAATAEPDATPGPDAGSGPRGDPVAGAEPVPGSDGVSRAESAARSLADDLASSSSEQPADEAPGGEAPTGAGDGAEEADVMAEVVEPLVDADALVAEAEAAISQDLSELSAERDEYLEALRRLQADFENYKKRMLKQQSATLERAGEDLVVKLLPVLDTVDLARRHGAGDGVEQVAVALLDVLAKEGLERLDPTGTTFDPNEHEAVAHEEGEGAPEVIDVLRAGYRWRGRLLRPALVTVKG